MADIGETKNNPFLQSQRPQNTQLERLGTLSYKEIMDNIVIGLSEATFATKYNILKKLGTGGFGVTYLVERKADNLQYAAKTISKSRFIRYDYQTRMDYFNDLRCEIDILKRVNHPNIVRLVDVIEEKETLFLVQELCVGGELLDRIIARRRYTEVDARDILKQSFASMVYLHSHNVAHCDIKPENFLFGTEHEDSPIKLIDFGMSRITAHREYLEQQAGTPYYMAPEVLGGHYNKDADVWSLGVVMFVLLYGYPPFNSGSLDANAPGADKIIMRSIRRGFTPVTKRGHGAWFPQDIKVSPQAKDLMSKLIVSDVSKRLTAREALEHEWFKCSLSETELASCVLSSLKTFTGGCKLRVALLDVFANELNDSQITQIKEQFHSMDLNHDGVINKTELYRIIKAQKESEQASVLDLETSQLADKYLEEKVSIIMQQTDLDGNGTIEYDELLKAVLNRRLISKEERLYNEFRRIDSNHNNKISINELKVALNSNKFMSDDQVKDMLEMADANGDQEIDYEEFLNIWYEKNKNPLIEDKFEVVNDSNGTGTSPNSCCNIL